MTSQWDERLSGLLEDRNLSEVSRKCGWIPGRLAQILGRRAVPNACDAARLCKYLGVTVESVFGEGTSGSLPQQTSGASRRVVEERLLAFKVQPRSFKSGTQPEMIGETEILHQDQYHGQTGFLPIVAPIAAGDPVEAYDKDHPPGYADSYVRFAIDDPSAFGLIVDGHSMQPDFLDGDIVIATPKRAPSRSVLNPMLAVVIFGSTRIAAFKLLVPGPLIVKDKPKYYRLVPLNHTHGEMQVHRSDVSVVFPVVGVVRHT